jgi:hypothetical protein
MLAEGADGVEDSGVRSEVDGWRIVGDANDGACGVYRVWEEGMANLAVPFSSTDGFEEPW